MPGATERQTGKGARRTRKARTGGRELRNWSPSPKPRGDTDGPAAKARDGQGEPEKARTGSRSPKGEAGEGYQTPGVARRHPTFGVCFATPGVRFYLYYFWRSLADPAASPRPAQQARPWLSGPGLPGATAHLQARCVRMAGGRLIVLRAFLPLRCSAASASAAVPVTAQNSCRTPSRRSTAPPPKGRRRPRPGQPCPR
jgi:hypothetical protein